MELVNITSKAPLGRSYWVLPGKLLAGYYPGDKNTEKMDKKLYALLDSGIRTFVNLMERNELDHDGLLFTPYDSRVKKLARLQGQKVYTFRHPVADLSVPSWPEMKRILDRIDENVNAGLPVYVHCWGGRGRTGVVVGCWLARHGIAQGMEAVIKIRHLRRRDEKANEISPQTDRQLRMILDWRKGE